MFMCTDMFVYVSWYMCPLVHVPCVSHEDVSDVDLCLTSLGRRRRSCPLT